MNRSFNKIKSKRKVFTAIDLFCGCGGLSRGLQQAGFKIVLAVDNSEHAIAAYRLNHRGVKTTREDIRKVTAAEIKKILGKRKLHLLAGCPPCQGFSTVRRLNKTRSVRDSRNALLLEFLRIVKITKPETIMLENVPGLQSYFLFNKFIHGLVKAKYKIAYEVVDVAEYGIPQRRKRFILVGSRLGIIHAKKPSGSLRTVRDVIGSLEDASKTTDRLHRVIAKHTERVQEMIRRIPKNGGSWSDLPKKYWLRCHLGDGIGFKDIYGRLRWDAVSSTITGGCLNPSKGRFLHPRKNRAITAREAAMLQSFPRTYRFPSKVPREVLASLIGNALPPKFSRIQSKNILKHLKAHSG